MPQNKNKNNVKQKRKKHKKKQEKTKQFFFLWSNLYKIFFLLLPKKPPKNSLLQLNFLSQIPKSEVREFFNGIPYKFVCYAEK